MRNLVKKLAAVFLIPLTRWYLRRKREYTYDEITVCIPPGVFHPGLFSSTVLILDYIKTRIVPRQTLLEVGSGSGLVSIVAARSNLVVTALDISRTAVESTILNARSNKVQIETIHSDLFTNMKKTKFDWVVINPPYYPRTPLQESDYAWYCGEHFEYFTRLFAGLPEFVHKGSTVVMVLTQGCDLAKIFGTARTAGFSFELVVEKKALFDGKDMLYRVHYES